MKRVFLRIISCMLLASSLYADEAGEFWRALGRVPSFALSRQEAVEEKLRFPALLLKVEAEVPMAERAFWERRGYEVTSAQRLELLALDPRHLIVRGGYGLVDPDGFPQMTHIHRVLDLCRYKGEGAATVLRPTPSSLEFNEGAVCYRFAHSDPAIIEDAFGQIQGWVKNVEQHPPLLDAPFAQLVRAEGFTHLAHRTRPENVLSILQGGKLRQGNRLGMALWGDRKGNHCAVFLSLLKAGSLEDVQNILHFTGNRLPVLLLAPETLGSDTPFHLSMGYPYGLFVPFGVTDGSFLASAHSGDPRGLQSLVRNPQLLLGNELVTEQDVSLDLLEMVLVKKGEKKELLQALADTPAPGGKGWDHLIVEVEPFHSQASLADEHECLFPYSKNSVDIIRYALRYQKPCPATLLDLLGAEYPYLDDLLGKPRGDDAGPRWKALQALQRVQGQSMEKQLETLFESLGTPHLTASAKRAWLEL